MKRKDYLSPETTALVLEEEGVICESGGIASMSVEDPIDGDLLFD